MNLCVLRVSGESFDVYEFLESSDFDNYVVWHKGEPLLKGYHKDSGFNLKVCEVAEGGLEEQTKKVIKFLRENFAILKRMMECSGVENGILDFAINKRDVAAQFDHFPAELIRLAGSLGLGIELSQYTVAEEDE